MLSEGLIFYPKELFTFELLKEDEVWEMMEQNKARSLEDGETCGARVGTQAMDALPPVTGSQT